MKSSIDGDYTDPFFGSPEEGYTKRLRAVVQKNSVLDLTSVIHSEGRAQKIVDTEPTGPKEVSKERFLDDVKELISLDRGRELPGMYNTAIIGQLFRKQSAPWKQILDRRAASILDDTCKAVRGVLAHILDDDVTKGVFRWILNPSLDDIGRSLKEKLIELMKPHEALHPITYNQSLVERVRERRLTQQKNEVRGVIKTSARLNSGLVEEVLLASLVKKAKRDLDRDASSDAVDWIEAYYDVREVTRPI